MLNPSSKQGDASGNRHLEEEHDERMAIRIAIAKAKESAERRGLL
jgi:hypothetical protein